MPNIVRTSPGGASLGSVGLMGQGGAPMPGVETPERELPWQRALAERTVEHILELSTIRPYVTNYLSLADGEFLQTGGQYVTRPTIRLDAPSAFGTAAWIDPANPTPLGAGPSFGSAFITPAELAVRFDTSAERRMDGYGITSDGKRLEAPAGESGFDPLIARLAAEALVRAEHLYFFQGSGTATTDAVAGLFAQAGVTSGTATLDATYGLDDVADAISTLRGRQRYPSVVWIGPKVETAWRRARVSATGPYYFDPAAPMRLNDLPVVTTPGITDGRVVVTDARAIVWYQRPMASGLPVRLDRSDHLLFTTDKVAWRAVERWGLGFLPTVWADSSYIITVPVS